MASTDEGVLEYNAPQFIDFSEPVADDATADKYFDFDHENGGPVRFSVHSGIEVGDMNNNLDIPSMTNNTAKDTAKRQTLRRESYNIVKDERSGQSCSEDNVTDSETAVMKADDEDKQVSEEKETTQEERVPKNLFTSLEDWRSNANNSNTTVDAETKVLSKQGAQSVKLSEELELEKIAEFRHNPAKKRKLAEESLKKSQSNSGHHPVRAEIHVTRPAEFDFATDDRIKGQAMETRSDHKVKSFEETLRHYPPSPVSHDPKKGSTVAKPSNVTDSRKKRKHDETQEEPTPDRFRLKPRSRGNTPQKRAVTAVSAAEEEMEVQEMKNYKLKANPINPKNVAKKQCTEAVGFDLETDHRTQIREASKQKKEEKYEFHPRTVPTHILEKPVEEEVKPKFARPAPQPGIPFAPKLSHKTTEMQPFSFEERDKDRLAKKEEKIKQVFEEEEKEEEVKPKFARPAPLPGIPFAPKLSHKTTEMQPYSFEERDKDRLAKKEEKIKQVFEEEEKARQFKAQSLPSPSIKGLPEKRPKKSTKPEPFNFLVEEKGAKAADEWRKKIEDEQKNQRAKASAFKAQPPKVLYTKPFVPEKGHKPLTDKRSQQREQFEQYKKHKEQKLEAEKVRRQKEESEIEADAIAKLRAGMVPKSNPIKHFKPMEVEPSTKPLTKPASPQFHTSQRLRHKPL
ncbi:targeting protein for Xklp2 homolog [Ptychodera flava]|uniref:targeting protein for Xklp2 homolog n=1 Tax=Ptychodera flava TaxID=63121 RepID=UPI003969EA24